MSRGRLTKLNIRAAVSAALFFAIAYPADVLAQCSLYGNKLCASSEDNTIILTWSAPTDPIYVEQIVHRKERSDRNYSSLGVTLANTAATFTDSTPEHGKKYSYFVEWRKASNNDPLRISERRTGTSDYIGIGNAPPRNLRAKVAAGYQDGQPPSYDPTVTLTWTPGTNRNYVRQLVLRRQRGHNWASVADLAADATTWTDQNVVRNEKYLYSVRGEKANGKGSRSARITVRIRPSRVPHGLAADTSGGAVVLTWVPGDNPNLVQQLVLRKQYGTDTWSQTATLTADAATWTDDNTTSGVQYFYRVRAEKANGKGSVTKRVGIVAP